MPSSLVVSRSFGEDGEQVKRQYLAATYFMDQRGQRAFLWTPIVLLMIVPFAGLLRGESRASVWTAGTAALGLLAGATIPTIFGYPVAHTILEPALAVGMVLYFGICCALAAWASRLLLHRRPYHRTDAAADPVQTASPDRVAQG